MSDIFGVWSKMKFIERLLQYPYPGAFFLFGARNTGKSTLLRHIFGTKVRFG